MGRTVNGLQWIRCRKSYLVEIMWETVCRLARAPAVHAPLRSSLAAGHDVGAGSREVPSGEDAVWDLVCHQTYKLTGMAVDVSDHDNNGRLSGLADQDFHADGAQSGSGAVSFPEADSRIWILPSRSLRPLGGVVVRVMARAMHADHAQTLVAGDGAFRLRIVGPYLFAFVTGDAAGINSFDDAIDLQPHPVPLGAWTQLDFVYDGFDTMELSFNEQVVARRRGVVVPVAPVGSSGMAIGNEPDDDGLNFVGDIDDVQLWRTDPDEMARQFVSRPLSEATSDCWAKYFATLREALAADSAFTGAFRDAATASIQQLVGSIAAAGHRADLDRFRAEYDTLWRRGELVGSRAEDFFTRYVTFLTGAGAELSEVDTLNEILSACFGQLLEHVDVIDCDRPFTGPPMAMYQASLPHGDAGGGTR